MDSSIGRSTLLGIRHDLFELDAVSLMDLGIQPGNEEAWVLSTLDLAKKYDRLRRRCEDPDPAGGMVDHGIAGALILYDILMDEYERFRPKEELSHRRDPSRPPAVHEGKLLAHAGHKRFAACAVVIACTVARHNMWTTKKSNMDQYLRYQEYGLSALCEGGSAAQIRGDVFMDQLLFLLCFMDTVDPVKGIYVREAERPASDSAALARCCAALLNNVFICFQAAPAHRWGTALKYRSFTISLDPGAPEDIREIFSCYAGKTLEMNGWLRTKPPGQSWGADGRIAGVT